MNASAISISPAAGISSPGRIPRQERLKKWLARPVSGASLAVFRIAVGMVMALEGYSLMQPNRAAIGMGTSPLETYYTGPDIKFNFPYDGFDWLPLFPPGWIHALAIVQIIAGLFMAAGLFSRIANGVVVLCWGYLFFVESTRTYWQSHYYLELLTSFLLLWMPSGRVYSVDAWWTRRKTGAPGRRTAPSWTIFLLRAQLVIAYFYAGVAKINLDWLVDGEPVRWFLTYPGVTEPYRRLLSPTLFAQFERLVHSVWFGYLLSYTGLIFDLAIGFILLVPRLRIFGLVLMAIFHLTNHFLIFDDIGWFPLVGVATAFIFLDASWPEQVREWVRRRTKSTGRSPTRAEKERARGPRNERPRGPEGPAADEALFPLARCTIPLILVWVCWQAFMPIRHYLIPGDGRFTYEGFSLCWRLKTDVRRANPVQIRLQDKQIVARDEAGRMTIHWNEWHGDRLIYRKVTPGRIRWEQLPEIVALREPLLGERVLYNPLSAVTARRDAKEARERAGSLWRELYGKLPTAMPGTRNLSTTLAALAEGLHKTGALAEAERFAKQARTAKEFEQRERSLVNATAFRKEVSEALEGLIAQNADGQIMQYLRGLDPFALEGECAGSFLVMEDNRIFKSGKPPPTLSFSPQTGEGIPLQIDPKAWQAGSMTAQGRGPLDLYIGGKPLVVFTSRYQFERKDEMPVLAIFDSQDNLKTMPFISWNVLNDLPPSKVIHVSNQAFYLRRYARRIAAEWKADYGRQPIVNAKTACSFNGRPAQDLVDPAVDLATVPVRWFGHNYWIRDLETRRIPPGAMVDGRPF